MLKFITLLFITFYLIQTIEAKTCYKSTTDMFGCQYHLNRLDNFLQQNDLDIIGFSFTGNEYVCRAHILYKC
jgi:hypothetical protein